MQNITVLLLCKGKMYRFASNLNHLVLRSHVGPLFTGEDQKENGSIMMSSDTFATQLFGVGSWRIVILLLHIYSALFMTSLLKTVGHKMAALRAVFLRI